MNVADIVGGTFGLVLFCILILWLICWFLVPFWIMSIRDKTENTEKLLKDVRSSLVNIERLLGANAPQSKIVHHATPTAPAPAPKQADTLSVGKYKFRDGKLDMNNF
jgi:hypothetical protein